MKLQFLKLPADERRLYIEQAAVRRNALPVILEKVFWVSWLLSVLFRSEFADSLVFKGGTSLSKVFGVIGRFSEDIDLSLSPEFLGLPIAGTSRNQANKWMKNAEAVCSTAVASRIAPVLEEAVVAVLGAAAEAWFEFITDPVTSSPVLLFHYPSVQPLGFEYLKRCVKLEFGSLTDHQPIGRHPIERLIAQILPEAFADWTCEVVVLEVGEVFGKRPRFSMPNITAHLSDQRQIDTLGTTRIRPRWLVILPRQERWQWTSFRGKGNFWQRMGQLRSCQTWNIPADSSNGAHAIAST